MPQATFCSNCSKPMRGDQKFCPVCGSPPYTPSYTSSKALAIERALCNIDSLPKSRFFSPKEIKELPDLLWDDELPEQCVTGNYHANSGILVATDRRMLFVDKGLLGQLKVEDFPYDKISSLESNRGILAGSIVIHISGNWECIDRIPKGQVNAFVAAQRKKVALWKNKTEVPPQTSHQPTPSSGSAIDELERLGKLRQQGILTQDEFEQAKARLIRDL